ncbi:hypothetical protein LTR28_000275 [Elasticomyces elasticus]|nr:hypothetical protein LTR28_000275 [Elasticomyces elasticus]
MPDARRATERAAPTLVMANVDQDKKTEGVNGSFANMDTHFVPTKSGHSWAFLGIPFGQSNDWQVGISDAQANTNMIFDAFLMRQQLNAYDALMFVSASLRSRTSSNKRMLKCLVESGKYETSQPTPFQELQQTEFLYMNSASSAWMVFILAFLANARERHNHYTTKCLEYIYEVDAALEVRLRNATGDKIQNETIVIPPPTRGMLQRGIDYYADLVGTLIGVAILFFAILIWVVIGPAMSFGSNWWLLIGTYAGLIGLNDGFVLRNVQNTLGGYEKAQFVLLIDDDKDMLALIGVIQLDEELVADNSLSCRISVAVGNVCAHEITVVLGAVLIMGLVIGTSAMGWSVTGRLLCNVPPSIIESFFMMVLITGHNIGDAKKRVDLHNIYLRRLKLTCYVNTLVKPEER